MFVLEGQQNVGLSSYLKVDISMTNNKKEHLQERIDSEGVRMVDLGGCRLEIVFHSSLSSK